MPKSGSGFTLVEVSVALALVSLLMVAIVGILRQSQTQLKTIEAERKEDWIDSAMSRIHSDLLLASTIRASEGAVRLEGEFPALDGHQSPRFTQQLSYHCKPWLDGGSVLLRQSELGGTPVAIGPRRLMIERLDSSGVPQPLSSQATPIPAAVRVWLWDDLEMTALVQRDLVIR